MNFLFSLLFISPLAFGSNYSCVDPETPERTRPEARSCTFDEAPSLFEAARKNCVNLVQQYAVRGDDLDPVHDAGFAKAATPLAEAVYSGALETAGILLAHGALPVAAPCFQGSNGCYPVTLLTMAVKYRDLSMTKLLMRYHAWTNQHYGYDGEALRQADWIGPFVQAILQDAKVSPPSIFLGLARTGSCDTFETLLHKGFTIDEPGYVLEEALYSNQLTMVDSLLDQGAPMFVKDRDANCFLISRLLQVQSLEMLNLLESKGVNLREVDCKGRNLLFAVKDMDMAEKALGLGLSANIVARDGWSPLGVLAVTLSDQNPTHQALWHYLRQQGASLQGAAPTDLPDFLNSPNVPGYYCGQERGLNLAFLAVKGNNALWLQEALNAGLSVSDNLAGKCVEPLDLAFRAESLPVIEALAVHGFRREAVSPALLDFCNREKERVLTPPDALRAVLALTHHGFSPAPPRTGKWVFNEILANASVYVFSPEGLKAGLEAMIAAGFDPALRDATGDCPGNYLAALENRVPEVVALLRDHGAKVCKRQ